MISRLMNSLSTAFRLLTPVFLTLFCTTVAAADGSWKLSTGLDRSEGDYGDPDDTTITYLPVSASYMTGNWTAKVTVPWVEIEGPGTVVGGGEGGVIVKRGGAGGNTGTESQVTTESGLGDIWVSGTYSVPNMDPQKFLLDLTAKLKLPTADEDKGLGTGEVDYTLQADVYQVRGRWTPMATIAYKVKGEPSGVSLDSVLYLSAGADYRVAGDLHSGFSLDYQEASSSGADDALELFGYLSQRFNSRWSGSIYSYLGLSDGSPDLGLGFQLTYRPQY